MAAKGRSELMFPSILLAETASIDMLRPIAVDGETVLTCVLFVPLSIAAIVATAFLRSLAGGFACAYSQNACLSASLVPVSPTSFGIPAHRIRASVPAVRPWAAASGFSFSTGWDSLRLYEIIAGGGLPYIINMCAPYVPEIRETAVLYCINSGASCDAQGVVPNLLTARHA